MRKTYVVWSFAIVIFLVAIWGAFWGQTYAGPSGPQPESLVNPKYDARSPMKPGIYVWGMSDTRYLLPESDPRNAQLGDTLPIQGHIIAFGWDELIDVDSNGNYIDNTSIVERRLQEICYRHENSNQVPVYDRWAAFYVMPYTGTPIGGRKIRIPEYMYDPSHPGYAARGNRDDAIVVASNGTYVPKYWTDYFIHEYEKLIIRLGRRLTRPDAYEKWRNCIAFIAIGTGRDGETWPVGLAEGPERTALVNAGLDSGLWINYVRRVTDAYVDQFRKCNDNEQLCYPLMLQAAPTFKNSYERKAFIDYGSQFGVGDSVNGLYPQQVGSYYGDGTGMYEPMLDHPDVPLAFEGYEYHVSNPPIGCKEDKNLYWALINSLDKHVDFLRLQVDLFFNEDPQAASIGPWYRPPAKPWPCPYGFCQFREGEVKEENMQMMRWVNRYLGATVDTTPSVWSVMRDYRVPWSTCWKINTSNVGFEPGNFDFWLYQRDDLPGGRTVPETNEEYNFGGLRIIQIGENFSPYNPDLPPDLKEAWYIRRTDQSTGNPYMFFDVEDEYLFGRSTTITVTITYVDMFTDTFSLHYEDINGEDKAAVVHAVYQIPNIYAPADERTEIAIPAGATAITKEGTKTLRQAVFVLTDARFRNNLPLGTGGADFYIDSNGDGDEWIHMAEVQVDRAHIIPEPSPTPTPTWTPTPSPTPTATPTPTTARIEGTVWEDQNRNYIKDAGEPGVPDAVLELHDPVSMSLLYTTTTNTEGQYAFAAVEPGSYKLVIVPPPYYSAPEPFNQPVDIGPLQAGQTYSDINFPLVREPTPTPTPSPTPTVTPTPTPAVIEGRVFVDANSNGQYDQGEVGIANIEISLVPLEGNTLTNVTITATTDAQGMFTFVNVEDGTYHVIQSRIQGYIPRDGYVRTLTVQRGETYNVTFPNRGIVQYIYIPYAVR